VKKILVVDDEPNNLQLLRQILKDHYHLMFAANGDKALDAANKHAPDLILLDIMMPGINGYDVCKALKANAQTEKIPVIFVTAMAEVDDEAYGFEVGAVDYIQKPLSGPIVLKRIQNQLSLVHMDELKKSHKQAIFMLGAAGHYNDADTGVHIWRMASYAAAIARSIGWSDQQVAEIELAAPMHDTGKIGIPDSILKAPRKLTADEWDVMKQHCEIGHGILSNSDATVFKMAAEIALNHHEKWNGSGYPAGLSGEKIPESAQIVAIADVFDALTLKRPYKEPWSTDRAVEEIKNGVGSHFSPRVAEHFFEILPEIECLKASWGSETTDLNFP